MLMMRGRSWPPFLTALRNCSETARRHASVLARTVYVTTAIDSYTLGLTVASDSNCCDTRATVRFQQ